MNENDWDLLERFARTRSNRDFGDLVSRHAGLVYATCRRRLRDTHLAEDATQAVFVLLARRPPIARNRSSPLAAWLYRTAIFTCNNAMRAKRLRAKREAEVVARNSTDEAKLPAEVEAQLDQAMSSLGNADRDVLLLRFYHDMNLAELASALAISPSAASKRATRAIDRLKRAFSRIAGTSGSATALAALPQFFKQSAPVGLIERSIAASTAGVASGTSSVAVDAILQGVTHAMLQAKAKLAAAVVVMTTVVTGGATWSVALLRAQSTPAPSSAQATTKPAHVNTPREALWAFIDAYRRADVPAVKQHVVVTTQTAIRAGDAVYAYLVASNDFRKSVEQSFGADAMQQVPELQRLIPFDYIRLIDQELFAQYEEIPAGDMVIIKAPAGRSDVFLMVQHEGQWKLSIDRITSDWTPEQTEERAGGIEHATAELVEYMKKVQSNAYKSLDELKDDMQPLLDRSR